MSSFFNKVGLGVPLPLLAPATATWTLPFAAYLVLLQGRIVSQRIGTKTALGDKTNGKTALGVKDPLYIATRAHANFAENVPFVFVVALLAELNGANRKVINCALGALLAFRVGHCEFGMLAQDGKGAGRPVGFIGTTGVLLSLAGYAAYLIKDFWLVK